MHFVPGLLSTTVPRFFARLASKDFSGDVWHTFLDAYWCFLCPVPPLLFFSSRLPPANPHDVPCRGGESLLVEGVRG